MKRWLKSVVSVFLGIIILVAGSSVTLAKMVCLKSGYTSITLNEPDDCCKHEHEHAPFTFEEKCCDVSSMHLEALQYLVSSSQNIEKLQAFIEVPAVAFNFDSYSEIVSSVTREHCDTELADSPPIRILTRTFII
jgi:hypothetical protein